MIADIEANKKLSPVVNELFLRERKLDTSLSFNSQSYFKVPRTIRLNATHYFIMKISNKRELQQIASNHSADIEFKDFMKPYKDYTKETLTFLCNGTTLTQEELFIKMTVSQKIRAIDKKLSKTKLYTIQIDNC